MGGGANWRVSDVEEQQALSGPGKGQTNKREEARGTHIEVRIRHVHPTLFLPSCEGQQKEEGGGNGFLMGKGERDPAAGFLQF